MALGAALVDRARVVRRAPTARKVEGVSEVAWVEGPWFKARLSLTAGQPGPADGSRARRQGDTPALMVGVRDLAGDVIEWLDGEAFVDVLSVSQGMAEPVRYRVNGDPTPIRKKRTVIGYEVSLARALDHGQGSVL